jgi:hypothetical protein
MMARKKKRTPSEAEIAQAVADAAEQAERGGRSSGIRIGEHRFHLEGRQLGTEATEGTEDAGATEQMSVDPPTEPTEATNAPEATEDTEEQPA